MHSFNLLTRELNSSSLLISWIDSVTVVRSFMFPRYLRLTMLSSLLSPSPGEEDQEQDQQDATDRASYSASDRCTIGRVTSSRGRREGSR